MSNRKYIHFKKEQKEFARNIDIVNLLRNQGQALKKSGSEYEWKDGSQKVTIRGNLWFHQYEQVGGDTIDFVRRFMNKDYVETMEYLLGNELGTLTIAQYTNKQQKEKVEFKLPKQNNNMRRVFAYLLDKRKIDKDVLGEFVRRNMIYEEIKYHNVVFVGYDKNGSPRHAHKRGTSHKNTYKGNVSGSVPEYSFNYIGKSNKIYLFEAPIDMISFISINKENWKEHSYASACSVSDRVLFKILEDNQHINFVYLCFDNDEAGQCANNKITEKLKQLNIQSKILIPKNKDWNEDLVFLRGTEEKECQVLQL